MRSRFLRWTMAAAMVGMFALASSGLAATCNLELKQIPSDGSWSGPRVHEYAMFRYTQPQHFFMQLGEPGRSARTVNDEAEFSKVIKKEPAKYASKHPFRGVAKLGSWKFGFVLDAAPPKEPPPEAKEKAKVESKAEAESKDKTKDKEKTKDEKKEPAPPKLEQYSRLYFDLNHNGDLTDDKPIEAEHSDGRVFSRHSYTFCSFPQVDVDIEADGRRLRYAFSLRQHSYASGDHQQANAMLNAAAYREGEIELEGKKRRVVVVDFNSNGRFDDRSKTAEVGRPFQKQLHPDFGDMIHIDPDSSRLNPMAGYDPTASDAQSPVSDLIQIDGQYYDVKITPAGDKLTLTPSSVPVGYVSNPNAGYRALVYEGKRILKVCGNKDNKAPLPAGEWKLLSYTIAKTGEEPAEKEAKKEEPKAESSLLQTLVEALVGGGARRALVPQGPRFTMVSARGTPDCKAVKVVKGETVLLPFGPPYKPIVTPQYRMGDNLSLSMSLVGSAGEVCSSLYVDGGQPAAPDFTITTPDGKEVEQGKFKYG